MNKKTSSLSTSVHIGVGNSESGCLLPWINNLNKWMQDGVSAAPYGMRVRVTVEVLSD